LERQYPVVSNDLSGLSDDAGMALALKAQRNEITEYHVYRRLSGASRNVKNKKILKHIAEDELKHYSFWKTRTHQNVAPNRVKIWVFYLAAVVFGITFAMKLMEKGEAMAQVNYGLMSGEVPTLDAVIKDESQHESLLVDLVDEDHLHYVGSILKGLNSAVVELVGALAGLTLVFRDSNLISVAGMVAGIAMTMSLVGTDYLGARTDSLFREKRSDNFRSYLKGPLYSGSTSLAVAFFLTAPFLFFENKFVSLALTITIALIAIFLFNFYVSVTRDVSFVAKVREMTVISLSTAALAFIGGYLMRLFLSGLDRIN